MFFLLLVIPKIAGDPSETYTVTEGETVVLPCDVSGTPPPTVSWRKNFVNFKPKSDRYSRASGMGMTVNDLIFRRDLFSLIFINLLTHKFKSLSKILTK